MYLFVSDLHLGRGAPADERAKERALVALLDAHAAHARGLFLVGDLFEAWIEYRHLIPRPPVRLLGALAAWVDAGRRVVVFAGNHDPWHRDFFQTEVGAEFEADGRTEVLYGRRVYVHHGDGLLPGGLYRRLRPVLRHPLPVGAYRALLPADAGMRLARWTARRIMREDDAGNAAALRALAGRTLEAGEPGAARPGADRPDAVVFGHTHAPEVSRLGPGVYANPGAWHYTRTFARLDADGFSLLRWDDDGTGTGGGHATLLAGPL